jgi:integrase/recombinase XerD
MDSAVADALGTTHPLTRHIGDFLTDLTNANKSTQTVRTYRAT